MAAGRTNLHFLSGPSLGAVAAALVNASAAAQTAPPDALAEPAAAAPNGGQRYHPVDFARFAPRTALDMVNQLPGFAILAFGGGDRGLGAARENVLINGERIADKSTDARTALSRINASAVRHIDIVDGASVNVPGLTGQVANIVLNADAARKFTTTLRWSPEVRPRIRDVWTNGEISTSGSLGGNDITLSFDNNIARRGHWGPE
ncbi:MAG: Plug domain-containing protein, partial [Sphingopyxis sp.]|nr:Plug domain-containing protein [Sphingopyxis sp.]